VAVAPDLVQARHRAATKSARRARRSGDAADFHGTRIRVKRLRYALEFVGALYDKQTTRYVRHVIRLQDALGVMQDARIAADQLHDLAVTKGAELSPVTLFVMGGVAQRYREESERRARKIPGLLRELRGPEWRRVASLMERRRPVPWGHPAWGGHRRRRTR
jgi:CHAD domain-containing protein